MQRRQRRAALELILRGQEQQVPPAQQASNNSSLLVLQGTGSQFRCMHARDRHHRGCQRSSEMWPGSCKCRPRVQSPSSATRSSCCTALQKPILAVISIIHADMGSKMCSSKPPAETKCLLCYCCRYQNCSSAPLSILSQSSDNEIPLEDQTLSCSGGLRCKSLGIE